MPRTTATPAKHAAAPARAAAKTTTKKPAAPSREGAAKKQTAPQKASKGAARPRSQAKAAAGKAPAVKAAPSSSTSTNARKAAVKQAPAKKAPAKKAAAKKAPAKKAAAKKASAKKASAKKVAAKVPAKKSPYGAKFLAAQEELLQHERSTYFRQFQSLQAEADALVADFESGDVQFDEESGEGDTINIERERDLALSAQARQAVEEIDHALAKIKAGTYGLCETSGEAIPKDRLEAIPWARERVEYKIGGFGRR